MTNENEIENATNGNFDDVMDIIGILRFTHALKMTELYNQAVENIRHKLLVEKFDTIGFEYNVAKMRKIVPVKIWCDIFRTTEDINKLASFDKLWAFQTAHEIGCLWDKTTCESAAMHGGINCLTYAHKHGCEWDEMTCTRAVENGYLRCLMYAHGNGCPLSEKICTLAAKHGHLYCLIYTHNNGCQWDETTCAQAAENGHLWCLKYAHEHGCSWDEQTCTLAAKNGHLGCLQYAHKHGCLLNEEIRTICHPNCIDYINRNFS